MRGWFLSEWGMMPNEFKIHDYNPDADNSQLIIDDLDRRVFGNPKLGDKVIEKDSQFRWVPAEYFASPDDGVAPSGTLWDIDRLTKWADTLQ